MKEITQTGSKIEKLKNEKSVKKMTYKTSIFYKFFTLNRTLKKNKKTKKKNLEVLLYKNHWFLSLKEYHRSFLRAPKSTLSAP